MTIEVTFRRKLLWTPERILKLQQRESRAFFKKHGPVVSVEYIPKNQMGRGK